MTTTMTSDTERQLLEPVANAAAFEYMMYVPTSFSHRSGHLYKREHARMSVRSPRVDDGDLFCMAVASPSVKLHTIIDTAFGAGRQNLEIRCAYIRESFVQAVAKAVTDSPSGRGSHRVFETCAAGEWQK